MGVSGFEVERGALANFVRPCKAYRRSVGLPRRSRNICTGYRAAASKLAASETPWESWRELGREKVQEREREREKKYKRERERETFYGLDSSFVLVHVPHLRMPRFGKPSGHMPNIRYQYLMLVCILHDSSCSGPCMLCTRR